jgi:hypothetical protein
LSTDKPAEALGRNHGTQRLGRLIRRLKTPRSTPRAIQDAAWIIHDAAWSGNEDFGEVRNWFREAGIIAAEGRTAGQELRIIAGEVRMEGREPRTVTGETRTASGEARIRRRKAA